MSPLTEPTRLTLAKSFTWNETVWNPSMIQTALWLDAADAGSFSLDGTLVNQWNDKSGNTRHATAVTPTRPNKSGNSVVFTADRLTVPVAGAPTNSKTLLAVMNSSSTNTGFNLPGFVNWETGASSDPEVRIGTEPSGNGVAIYYNGSYAVINPTAGFATRGIVAIEFTGNTTTTVYRNGSQVNQGSSVGGFSAVTGFNIGFFVGTNSYRDGQLDELIVLDSDTTNRRKTEGYLAWKWGLTANLPNDHPYKTVGPTP